MKALHHKLLVLLMAVFAVSCSSDEAAAPFEVRENRLLKEIGENTTKTYTYNANNQLIKITELGDLGFGTTQSVENYTYGADGKVTEVKADYTGASAFGFKYLYSYDSSGRIFAVSVKRYTGSSGYSNFSVIYFDYTNPNTIERYESRVADPAASLTYYDIANGNTTGYTVYTGVTANTPNGVLNSTTLYSNYDTNKTPFEGLPLLNHEPKLSVNNPRQTQSSGSVVNYTYEYNADGYPTKKTTAFNGNSSVVVYQYERL